MLHNLHNWLRFHSGTVRMRRAETQTTRLITALFALLLAPAHAQGPDLFSIIGEGDVPALRAALDTGADPNVRQAEGYKATPLMWAASRPGPEMASMLLEAGAQVNARDAMGDPAINWATYYGHAGVVAALLDAGADPTLFGHGQAADIAMRMGHQDVLAVLVSASASKTEQSTLERALESATASGAVEVIHGLAALTSVAHARDWSGRPLLHTAARAGEAAAASTLIEAGADVNGTDAIGFTALFEAAREGRAEMVNVLIAAGADLNHVADPSGMGLTPLHLAAIGGDVATVEALLRAGVTLDARGTNGGTAFLWGAFEGKRDVLLTLIGAGADPTIPNDSGDTVLPFAESQRWHDVVAAIRAFSGGPAETP